MDGEDDVRGEVDDAERRPLLRSTVLDATDARGLAEFYRQLLGWDYRPGDEAPPAGEPDPHGTDWLVLRDPAAAPGTGQLALQQVPALPRATWPTGPHPQQVHVDLSVATRADLDAQHQRAVSLGAELLADRSEDPHEPLRVYADPAGHPFCLFLAPDHPAR